MLVVSSVLWGGAVYGQSAAVTYVEGGVDLRPHGRPRSEALIGDAVLPGDSIITGADGLAQLQKSNLSQITVSPDTVFTVRRIDDNGTKHDVLFVSLGSLAFKFNQLGGKEPLIATMSATAGIRGTVLKVYAGADGSSLFVVEAGKVSVTGTGGNSVDLTSNEGVEVAPGQPPGRKIKVLRGQISYASWNERRLKNLLLDPAGAALNVEKQMNVYIAHITEIWPKYQQVFAQLTSERAKLPRIEAKEGKQAQTDFYGKTVYPLEVLSNGLFLNLRYYTLSALSLRRYVLGRMYTRLTSLYITDEASSVYRRFLRVYRRIIAAYERSVVPHLVTADI
jgi:hypothetical protein